MNEGKARRTNYVDHLYFAAFICVIGIALFAVALGSIKPSDESADQGYAWGILVPVAIGISLLFLGIHAPAYLRSKEIHLRLTRRAHPFPRWAAQAGLVFAGSLLVGYGFWGFAEFSRPADPTAVQQATSHFALLIPGEEPQTTVSASRQLASRTPPRPPEENRDAMLFWSVASEPEPKNAGLLPMFLASLLTMVFGLSYPRIAMSGDEEGRGFVQKLVVPALGMALFGVGVSEKAQADATHRDLQLVSKGLQPIHSLSKEQKAYIRTTRDVSGAGIRELQDRLAELAEQVRLADAKNLQLSEDNRTTLLDQIAVVRAQLYSNRMTTTRQQIHLEQRLAGRLTAGFKDAAQSARSLQSDLRSAAAQTRADFLRMDESEKLTFCALLHSQMALAENQQSLAFTFLDRQDKRAAENAFKRAWLSLTGRDLSDLRARTEAIRGEVGIEHLQRIERINPECRALFATPVPSQ